MEVKTTNRLFKGTYQYKAVLVCPGAQHFRSGDMDSTLESLKKVILTTDLKPVSWRNVHIKTQDDLDYAFKLQKVLKKFTAIEIRVESPWISVYSNDKSQIDALVKIDKDRVKYISVPPNNSQLATGTVIMPKTDYDFRITLGKTVNNHTTFVEWAEKNSKIKLTKSSVKDLNKDRSWGGTHFYVTGDNNLLMAKMHLGGCIAKVERIIKA